MSAILYSNFAIFYKNATFYPKMEMSRPLWVDFNGLAGLFTIFARFRPNLYQFFNESAEALCLRACRHPNPISNILNITNYYLILLKKRA